MNPYEWDEWWHWWLREERRQAASAANCFRKGARQMTDRGGVAKAPDKRPHQWDYG